MRILSFQPSSLYQNGGAGRLLRRLYQNHESDIISLYVANIEESRSINEIKEIMIPSIPLHKSWMKWKLRPLFSFLRESVFFYTTKAKIIKKAKQVEFDVLHIINHGLFSPVLCNDSFLSNKKLWCSFHDHFSLCSTYNDTSLLWNRADRRLVISDELGLEYQKLFGDLQYEVITDGVYKSELPSVEIQKVANDYIKIYFGGLLHLDYYPLFHVLADALDQLMNKDRQIKLILRGTQELPFLNNRKFSIEYRRNFVSDEIIKREIDEADILYLPIPFNKPEFYLYSLSTKMVGYLGAKGVILYQGPKDAAVHNLLMKYNAASTCNSLDKNELEFAINKSVDEGVEFSLSAKKLAVELFDMQKIQKKFWT